MTEECRNLLLLDKVFCLPEELAPNFSSRLAELDTQQLDLLIRYYREVDPKFEQRCDIAQSPTAECFDGSPLGYILSEISLWWDMTMQTCVTEHQSGEYVSQADAIASMGMKVFHMLIDIPICTESAIVCIQEHEDINPQEIRLIALFHDLKRPEQFATIGGFDDSRYNHGYMGAEGFLTFALYHAEYFEDMDINRMYQAILNHNRYAIHIPDDLAEEQQTDYMRICSLIKEIDCTAILLDYENQLANIGRYNSGIISAPVHESIMQGNIVLSRDKRTQIDAILFMLAWLNQIQNRNLLNQLVQANILTILINKCRDILQPYAKEHPEGLIQLEEIQTYLEQRLV